MLFSLRHLSALVLGSIVAGCASSQSVAPSKEATAEPASTPQVAVAITPMAQPLPQLAALDHPDPATTAQVQQYLSQLAAQGFARADQGVWIQSGNQLLANHQGTVPLSAASLTKVATSLAALKTFGPSHQFVTQVGATGPITNGVLNGDLVIEGNQDPFFVWEEAIAVGNLLNQLQIRRVTGNLIIVGKFYMNYESSSLTSGALLKQGINASEWSEEVATQHATLPSGTPRPRVEIAGSIQGLPTAPRQTRWLLRHYSPQLAELLKKMNRYSNNAMAEMLARSAGGATVVAQTAAKLTGVPTAEIHLVNGSGLSPENRISPRAVCAMFQAIEQLLRPQNLSIADIFTVVGKDSGILDGRNLPLAIVKSGSLDAVSALGGILPTQQQGIVWFVIMNGGGANLEGFRASQEALLQTFVNQWGSVLALPPDLTPTLAASSKVARSERATP